MFEDYLLSNHVEDLMKILEDPDTEKHFSITINFVKLFERNTEIGNDLLKEPARTLSEFDKSTVRAQKSLMKDSCKEQYSTKTRVHTRISGLPACPELHRTVFPTSHDLGSFLQLSGTVVRMTAAKMLEYQRQYQCMKCKQKVSVQADYEQRFVLQPPKKCAGDCNGKNVLPVKNRIESDNCKDYQEIKMQEQASKLAISSVPSSMWVTLEDDLVDRCKPGDDVTVCGIVMRRWKPPSAGKKLDIELVFRANHVQVNNDQKSVMLVTPEVKAQFRAFWDAHRTDPLAGRDLILRSFCPQLYGVYLMKLATAVILAGGSRSQKPSDTGIRTRSEPHLLLVGDPGTGKSQMLRFAAKVMPRSVLTTGIGSTSAGLTVAAVMEDGEWQLEAGALVLADGGICCIDEFSSMKEHDRASIHEAMEQQTISVAKASMVCKLSSRCSVLAATNPKGPLDASQAHGVNVALASPLLSRFDLVLVLRDTLDDAWDDFVCDHILGQQVTGCCDRPETGPPWTLELLQAYYMVIKSLHPVLTPEANCILGGYYRAQRQAPVRNVARTTVRLLDSLVRLSQAHARLMFRSEVTVMDSVMAIALVESSMHGAAVLLPANVDTLHAPFPDDPARNYVDLVTAVLGKLQLHALLDCELKSLLSSKVCMGKHLRLNETESLETGRSNGQEPNQNTNSTVVDVTLTQIRTMNNVPKLFNRHERSDYKIVEIVEKTPEPKRKSKCTTPNRARKKNKTAHKSDKAQGEVNDMNLLKLIPSINDVYRLNDDDVLNDCSENKPVPVVSTQERRERFTKKINTLKEQFAFQAKKRSPTNGCPEQQDTVVGLQNDAAAVVNVNKEQAEYGLNMESVKLDNVVVDTSSKTGVHNTEENTSASVNSNKDSQSESSQLSAKTLFQNDDDDLDLEV